MASRKDNKGRVLQTGESQRKDLTYMYRYTDRFQQRQCVYANTLTELRKKEKEIAAREYLHLEVKKADKTLLDLVAHQQRLYSQYRHNTKQTCQVSINLIKKYPISTRRADQIRGSELKLWCLDLINEGYAVSTVCSVMKLIKAAYRTAVEDGTLIASPASFKMNFLPAKEKRKALTPEEQQNFLKFLKAKKRRAIYLDFTIVLLGTGMRIGEFAGLTKQDIDFEAGYINITHQLQGNAENNFYIEPPKTNTGYRKIPMSNDVKAALLRIINRADQSNHTYRIDGQTDFIVRMENGKVQGVCAISNAYRRLRERYEQETGVPIMVTPHVLRHTFCTNMAHAGMSTPSLMYLMGHATAATTLDVYTTPEMNSAHKEFSTLHKNGVFDVA